MVRKNPLGYFVAVIVIAAATIVLRIFGDHINPTTVALAFLLIVVFLATAWGPKPAIVASLLGVACFNFFFLPPLHTFTIADPENWIALFAFLITAITVGQLSAHAKRRAEEANVARRESEALYSELQDTFEQASQTKALKQSERLKSALLDAVTHDLRTPLASIKASVTTLLDDQPASEDHDAKTRLGEADRREMLEVIDEECDRLNRFIGGLIELARIEAGEMQLRWRWGAVEEIISAALARAKPLTHGRRVKLDIEAELPVVRLDEQAVSEVVYTLIDNAAKYSPPETTIKIVAKRSGDSHVEMSVEDLGVGIPPYLRQRVFEKFFRATRDGDVSTNQPSGTGMGLAIAKGIIEAHNGRIWIESGAGGIGTRVLFTLPIGDEDEPNRPLGQIVAAEQFSSDL